MDSKVDPMTFQYTNSQLRKNNSDGDDEFQRFIQKDENKDFDCLLDSAPPFVVGVRGVGEGTATILWIDVPVEEEEMVKVKQMVDYARKELKMKENDYNLNVLCFMEHINNWARVSLGHKLNRKARYEITFETKQPEENAEIDGLEGELAKMVKENGHLRDILQQAKQLLTAKEAKLVNCQNQLKESQEQCEKMGRMEEKYYQKHGQQVKTLFEMLISNGVNLNEKGKTGQTLLNYALQNTEFDPKIIQTFVKALVSRGANLNEKDDQKKTPLHHVVVNQNLEPSIVEFLLDHGANDSLEVKDDIQKTPLLWAAQKAKPGIVEALLMAGADVKATNTGNWTSLHYAIGNPNPDVLRILLDYMNDRIGQEETKKMVNSKTKAIGFYEHGGDTALHLAYKKDNKEAIKLLEQYGADGTIMNSRGKKPWQCVQTHDFN